MIFSLRECTNSCNICFHGIGGSPPVLLNCNDKVPQICYVRFLVASVTENVLSILNMCLAR